LSHTQYIERFLIPHLGTIRLAELTTRQLTAFFAAVAQETNWFGQPHTPTTLAHIRTTLRAALNSVIRQGLIPDNPARQVELPSRRRAHALIWTPGRVADWHTGGNRQLNSVLHTIAVCQARDPVLDICTSSANSSRTRPKTKPAATSHTAIHRCVDLITKPIKTVKTMESWCAGVSIWNFDSITSIRAFSQSTVPRGLFRGSKILILGFWILIVISLTSSGCFLVSTALSVDNARNWPGSVSEDCPAPGRGRRWSSWLGCGWLRLRLWC
jgi:hypothetical protein